MNVTLGFTHLDSRRNETELPPVNPNEFNDEIYLYLMQLHKLQMQQRHSTDFPQIPDHVQQARNLVSAFLSFTDKFVERAIAIQIECDQCQLTYEQLSFEHSTNDDHARIYRAAVRLNNLVDAHASHEPADQEGFFLAKLSCSIVLGKLQASERLSCLMTEIPNNVWSSRRQQDGEVPPTSDETLRLEWKKLQSDLKALYHHYLYVLRCMEVVEESKTDRTREQAIAKVRSEQLSFEDRVKTIISRRPSEIACQDVPSHHVLKNTTAPGKKSRDFTLKMPIRTRFEKSDTLVKSSEDHAKVAREACDRFLDSLKGFSRSTGNIQDSPSGSDCSDEQSSCLAVSDGETTNNSTIPHQDTFASLSKSWILLRTAQSRDHLGGLSSSEEATEGPSGDNHRKRKHQGALKKGQASRSVAHETSASGGFEEEVEGGDSGENSEDEDNDKGRKKQKLPVEGESRGFACPFFKRNPEKHAKLQTCSSTVFLTIHRLKEHLYRQHRLPIHCPRCLDQFSTTHDLDNHLRQDNPCERKDGPHYTGFGIDKERILRNRKRNANNAEGWKEIYRVLFPDDKDDEIPPHYHDKQIKSILYYNSLVKKQLCKRLPILSGKNHELIDPAITLNRDKMNEPQLLKGAENNIINRSLEVSDQDFVDPNSSRHSPQKLNGNDPNEEHKVQNKPEGYNDPVSNSGLLSGQSGSLYPMEQVAHEDDWFKSTLDFPYDYWGFQHPF
ncbi:hypothetical protein, variant [Verruconis gallopava]|uniref:C2H2-type domain-containing protein n=1 Tax=Verruconis gallopava TaxID=253628 RepID=A0A0D2A6G4_9PEZI|nr:hypothetical protein, variant [Verruconis gallopava]KIW02165.1 hypothetical protein, variant [Verruconis gallopava]